MKTLFVSVLATLVVAGVNITNEKPADEQHRTYVLDGYLNVPSQWVYRSDFERDTASEFDAANDVLLLVPIDVIKMGVPEFGGKTKRGESLDGVMLLVAKLSDKDKAQQKNPHFFRDLKNHQGLYENSKASLDDETGLYKVPVVASDSWWIYLNVDPQEVGDRLDYEKHWVASCQKNKPMELVSCRARVLLDDLLIEFTVYQDDVKNIQKLKDFFSKMVSDFRANR